MRCSGRLIFFVLLFFFRHFSSNMTSSRLRRRLKDKKGVNCHTSSYRLKNYDYNFETMHVSSLLSRPFHVLLLCFNMAWVLLTTHL
jgi:hypothetical protein